MNFKKFFLLLFWGTFIILGFYIFVYFAMGSAPLIFNDVVVDNSLVLRVMIVSIVAFLFIHRLATWSNKYNQYEKYLSYKQIALSKEMYEFLLQKEYQHIKFHIQRRKTLRQESDSKLEKSLKIVSQKMRIAGISPQGDELMFTSNSIIGRWKEFFMYARYFIGF